jgi:predicted dienelactone hydrolase
VRHARRAWTAHSWRRWANRTCKLYLGDAVPGQQDRCHRLLRSRLHLDPKQLQRFLQTDIGETLLNWAETLFHAATPQRATSPASLDPASTAETTTTRQVLREFLLQMATDPQGLSLAQAHRGLPKTLRCNLDRLLGTAEDIQALLQNTHTVLAQIRDLAAAAATTSPAPDFDQQPDWRQPGPFAVQTFALDLEGRTEDGSAGQQSQGTGPEPSLRAIAYQPQPWPEAKTPVVVQSHGLGASPEDLAPYGHYLASHGYFVVAPYHRGSDGEQVRQMLSGDSVELFQQTAFVNRPRTISRVLDVLGDLNLTRFDHHLGLTQVGMIGHSLGAYTAFVLAGAQLQLEGLKAACVPVPSQPNLSLLLQCQALGLAPQVADLHDARIAAIIAVDAVGSELLGATGLGQVQVPTLLIAGSHDTTAPLVLEQIRLFEWLHQPPTHLAVIQGKGHVQNLRRLVQALQLKAHLWPTPTAPPDPVPFEGYIKALSRGFFQRYLRGDSTASTYLTAAYGQYLSQPPFDLWCLDATAQAELQTRCRDELAL